MSTRREVVKCVVSGPEKAQVEGRDVYMYTIVGAILADKRIHDFDANKVVLAGSTWGLLDALERTPQGYADCSLDDANSVLTNLGRIHSTLQLTAAEWRVKLHAELKDGWRNDKEVADILECFDEDVTRGAETPAAIARRLADYSIR